MCASLLILSSLFGVIAGAATCREECERERKVVLGDLDTCLTQAKKSTQTEDRLHRSKLCREQNRLPDCQKLGPCSVELNKPLANLEVSKAYLALSSDATARATTVFQRGQDVWIHYAVNFPSGEVRPFGFDQEVSITNAQGQVIYSDRKEYARNETYASTQYRMKSSFNIPKNFEVGRYTLELKLREQYVNRKYRFLLNFSIK